MSSFSIQKFLSTQIVTNTTKINVTRIFRILERSVSQSSLGEPEVPKIEALARLGSNSSFSNLVGRDNETPNNGFPQVFFRIYS